MADIAVTPMDQVTICNFAISLTGQGKLISSINDPSAEARACNLHYQQSLFELLGEYSWRFATKKAALALIRSFENTPADAGGIIVPRPWLYEYAMPTDLIKVRRLPNGARHDSYENLVEFEIGDGVDLNGNPARIIYSNRPCAWGQYVFQSLDPTRYPPLFIKALYYLLGSKIAPSMTQKADIEDGFLQKYAIFRDKAIAEDLRQGERLLPRRSQAEMSRGGFGEAGNWGSFGPGSVGPGNAAFFIEG